MEFVVIVNPRTMEPGLRMISAGFFYDDFPTFLASAVVGSPEAVLSHFGKV